MEDVFTAVDERPKRRQGITGQTIEAQMRGTMCQITEYELDTLRDEISRLTDERDQALARLAAAYKAADICALTPADAEAALQRVVDATWNEAVEAAAVIAAMHGKPPNTQWANGYTAACRDNVEDILTLKRPETSHEQ